MPSDQGTGRDCAEKAQTLGPDDAKNVCIDGTDRVRDVHTLQSADVEIRGKLCDDWEDLVLGCFQGTLFELPREERSLDGH